MLALAVTAITCSTAEPEGFQISTLYGRSSRGAAPPPHGSCCGGLSSGSPDAIRRSKPPRDNGAIEAAGVRTLRGIMERCSLPTVEGAAGQPASKCPALLHINRTAP